MKLIKGKNRIFTCPLNFVEKKREVKLERSWFCSELIQKRNWLGKKEKTTQKKSKAKKKKENA